MLVLVLGGDALSKYASPSVFPFLLYSICHFHATKDCGYFILMGWLDPSDYKREN